MTIKAKILMFVLACGAITLLVAGVGTGSAWAEGSGPADGGEAAAMGCSGAWGTVTNVPPPGGVPPRLPRIVSAPAIG